MISERLQQPGSFEISLKADTPLSVRESVPYSVSGVPFGHIAVTPQRLPPQSFTRAQVLGVAYWCGRIQSRSNRMTTYAGNGLPVWLGDADNKADYISALGGGAPATMTSLVTTLLASNGNGITLGSTAADTGITKTTSFSVALPITVLNELADSTSNAWRVNPDGTLDLGAPATLFVDPPTVILTRGEGGSDLPYSSLYCADLDVEEDFDDYATIIVVNGQGATGLSSAGTAGFTAAKDFGGTNNADLLITISANTSTGTACNNTGTTYLNLHKTSRRQVKGSISGVNDPRAYMEPGDQVYLYEPEAGLLDLTKSIPSQGRFMNPTTAQVRGMTWPVVETMGVYSIQTQDGSNTIVDLTDWVEFETGATQLELGAPRRGSVKQSTATFGTGTA